eukprot:365228-Chlamydomonas_euryale.AAC.24
MMMQPKSECRYESHLGSLHHAKPNLSRLFTRASLCGHGRTCSSSWGTQRCRMCNCGCLMHVTPHSLRRFVAVCSNNAHKLAHRDGFTDGGGQSTDLHNAQLPCWCYVGCGQGLWTGLGMDVHPASQKWVEHVHDPGCFEMATCWRWHDTCDT